MSIYRPKDSKGRYKSPFYHYDFQVKVLGGRAQRFYGSTGQRTRRAAEAVEAALRERAALGQLTSLITVDEACNRYWDEVGQHLPSAINEAKCLEYLSRFLGPDTLLVGITPELVANAAAKRLRTPVERIRRVGDELRAMPTRRMPATSTVNRQIVEPLRRVLKRAKIVWRIPIDLEQFDWGALSYREPAARTRELSQEEEQRFWSSIREDYHPICEIYIISGRRRSDWVKLSKFKVDRTAGSVRFPTRKRKEQGEIVIELTDRELEIICQEWDKAPDCPYVFTFIVQHGPDAGKRKPITVDGLRRVTDTAFRRAGLTDFKRHDFRHTFASRALRANGDLRTLMGAMDHQDISSTVRYAHMAGGQVKEMRQGVGVKRPGMEGLVPLKRGKK